MASRKDSNPFPQNPESTAPQVAIPVVTSSHVQPNGPYAPQSYSQAPLANVMYSEYGPPPGMYGPPPPQVIYVTQGGGPPPLVVGGGIINCRSCGYQGPADVVGFQPGIITWLWCLLLCWLPPLCILPWCCPMCMDARVRCPNCGTVRSERRI